MTGLHKFRWLQFEFELEFIDSPLWGNRIGTVRTDSQHIRIDAGAALGVQKTAVLHEFLHCVSDYACLNLTERQLAQLALFLIRGLRLPPTETRIRDTVRQTVKSLRLPIGHAVPVLQEALVELVVSAPQLLRWLSEEEKGTE